MKTFILIAILFCSSAYSEETNQTIHFLVHHGEAIKNNLLKTGNAGVKFEIQKTHTVVDVSPHSEIKLDLDSGTETVELLSGMARARVQKQVALATGNSKVKFFLKTKMATMGVRGTDFMAIVTPILGESEIIVFEGKVDFTSAVDAQDSKSVGTGHWGGIGGRFGQKTHDLIALTKETLDYFSQASTVQ